MFEFLSYLSVSLVKVAIPINPCISIFANYYYCNILKFKKFTIIYPDLVISLAMCNSINIGIILLFCLARLSISSICLIDVTLWIIYTNGAIYLICFVCKLPIKCHLISWV